MTAGSAAARALAIHDPAPAVAGEVMPRHRFLYVSYFFPPVPNSGTFRPMKFSKYLPEHGWDPLVLAGSPTAEYGNDPALLSQLPTGLDITYVPLGSDTLARRIAAPFRLVGHERRVREGLAWRLRMRHPVPDPFASWIGPTVRAGEAVHRRHRASLVFASGYPWSSLIAGRDLARRLNLPLVAEFRDPWSADDVLRGPLSPADEARHRSLERSVLDEATVVISVNDHLSASLRMAGARNVITIPNGFDLEDDDALTPEPRPHPDRLRMVYTGVWKRGYGPDQLYEAVASLLADDPTIAARLEVVAAGFAAGPAESLGVDAVIQELGGVPHARALGLMRSADVLFLPLANGSHRLLQVPGKLYEYLAANRPILAVADPASATAALLDRIGGGRCINPDNRTDLVTAIRQILAAGQLAVDPVDRATLLHYERRTLASRLAAVFHSVVTP